MYLPKRVTLREVAPRDGFQSLPAFIPTPGKLHIIEALVKAGVKRVEASSFVSPKAIPQLRDAAEIMAGAPRGEGVTHAALVPNLRGARDAVNAGADELVALISASEAHNRANVRRSIQESLADLNPIFELAAERGVKVIGSVAVAFGCPYQGEVPEPDVLALVESFIRRGASAIILADTTGMATPVHVDSLVRQFQDRHPGAECILHFHNNRGTAMANLLAALMAGATTFDAALGGIGGCPNVPQAAGNLPTEDAVCMLENMGVRTGIDLNAILAAARQLEDMLGFVLPGQVMKSGPRFCGCGQG